MWAFASIGFALIGLVGIGLLARIASGDNGNSLDDVDGIADGDVIDGSEDSQPIFVNDGADVLLAGKDNDKASGGDGSDLVFGKEGADVVVEGSFIDQIRNDGTTDAALLDTHTPALEDSESDELNGGFGNDLLLLGGNDIASGGGKTDAIVVGDWITPENPATITDFEPESETILFLYEGSTPPDAFITETEDGTALALDDPDQPIVFLNGIDFLELTAANIAFEPIGPTVV
ncbi:MAG: hypothetical protein AAFV87_10380 [Pseudomonadota bacterium]